MLFRSCELHRHRSSEFGSVEVERELSEEMCCNHLDSKSSDGLSNDGLSSAALPTDVISIDVLAIDALSNAEPSVDKPSEADRQCNSLPLQVGEPKTRRRGNNMPPARYGTT